MQQLAIEHKATNKHQVFELNDNFDTLNPEELIVHIGLDTYTLKTTKTEKELDLEKRVEFFQEKEFPILLEMFKEFGEVQSDGETHSKLVIAIKDELVKRIETSDSLKTIYAEMEDKDTFIHKLMESFAQHTAMLKGIKNYTEDALKRRTHKCFPMDYCNRVLNVMRDILQDKYTNLDELNTNFSRVFQDASIDTRPKVGLMSIILGLEEFTKFLADVMRAGKKVEIYEIKDTLHNKAEFTFGIINDFKNKCVNDSKDIQFTHNDKFTDYILQFHDAVDVCIKELTDLDKKQHTANMDDLELRHYIDTTIQELYTLCDSIILKYTMDNREELSEYEDAYIVGYYTSIYSTCENKTTDDNKYIELYRHLVNLNMQQQTLFEKTGFPDDSIKFKQYVEHEYTNILHNNSKPNKC